MLKQWHPHFPSLRCFVVLDGLKPVDRKACVILILPAIYLPPILSILDMTVPSYQIGLPQAVLVLLTMGQKVPNKVFTWEEVCSAPSVF